MLVTMIRTKVTTRTNGRGRAQEQSKIFLPLLLFVVSSAVPGRSKKTGAKIEPDLRRVLAAAAGARSVRPGEPTRVLSCLCEGETGVGWGPAGHRAGEKCVGGTSTYVCA